MEFIVSRTTGTITIVDMPAILGEIAPTRKGLPISAQFSNAELLPGESILGWGHGPTPENPEWAPLPAGLSIDGTGLVTGRVDVLMSGVPYTVWARIRRS